MIRFRIALAAAAALGTIIGPQAAAQAPTIIRSTNAPVWGSVPKLVRELRIGVLDGDEEYMFGRIADVAVGKAGQIIVAEDGQKPLIRQYDASGKFERKIGGFGEGPGEYRSIGGIRTFADGRLAVWDNRIRRLTTFTADGQRITNARVSSGLFSSDLLRVDQTGDIYIKTVANIDPKSKHRTYAWIHVAPDLRVTDTIAVPDSPSAHAFVLATPAGFDRPFSPEVISTMTAHGALLTGPNDKYAFELRRKGAPTVRIERSFTALAPSAAEHAEWTAWAENMEALAKQNARATDRPGGPYVVPKLKPAFKDLTSDSDGRIWVRRYVAAVSRPGPERAKGDNGPRRMWREPNTFDVFEPTGRLLGTIVLPWDASFTDAIGMKVYVVQTGPDGDESVQRFRIEPSK